MKTVEFVEFMQKNMAARSMKDEQVVELIKKTLNVKKYLGIKDKKKLVEDIVNECILYEDGVFKFDNIEKYICFTMRMIEAYTDLELSDDIEDDYDKLSVADLLTKIVSSFDEEYNEMNILLQMRCEYILSENNIAMQVGRFLGGVSHTLDTLVYALANNLDLSKIQVDKKDLEKILKFVQSYSK